MLRIYFKTMRELFKTCGGLISLIIILMIFNYTGSFMPLVSARLIETAQEYLSGSAGADRMWELFALMCVLSAVSGITYMLYEPLNNTVIRKGMRSFGLRLFHKMCSIPQILFEDSKSFEKHKLAFKAINSSYEENPMLGIGMVSLNTLDGIISNVINIAILVSFSPKLLIFALISTPLSVFISVASENAKKKMRRGQAQKTRETDYLWSLFCKKESVKEMRVFGAGGFMREKWRKTRDEMIDEEIGVQSKILTRSNLGDIIKNLFYALNVAFAVYLIIQGEISIGEFTACLGVFASLQATLVSFMYNLETFYEALGKAEEYYSFMELEDREDGTEECTPFSDSIELKNISFRYPNMSEYALNNIDLKIKKGEKIVIVGENGSGKTTLSKLITGAYTPEIGAVRIDGKNIENMKRDSYMRNISMVSQNFVRYSMTLRENVGISDTERINNDEEITSALKMAEAEETAETIGSIDAQLGREFGGSELSGGQWQRIAIARGIFRKSPIIILDEPTAALDPLMEYEILSRFIQIAEDRTAIIISHRIGICTAADRIIVMKDGEIVEEGSHEELMKANGEYFRMWQAQVKWMRDDRKTEKRCG